MIGLRLPQCIVAFAIFLALPTGFAAAQSPKEEEACTSAFSAPICVAKTWFGCQIFDPALCDLLAVSRGNFIDDYMKRMEKLPTVARKAPWKLTYEDLERITTEFSDYPYGPLGETYYYGTRRVTHGRFKSEIPHDPSLEGTAEVMLEHVAADTAFTESVFVVPDGNRWRFASYYVADTTKIGEEESYHDKCDGSFPGCGLMIPGIKHWRLISPNGDPIKP